MTLVPWAALGSGQFISAEQREHEQKNLDAREGYSVTSAKEDKAK